jgi:protein TonB
VVFRSGDGDFASGGTVMQTQNLPRSPAQGRLVSIVLVAAIHVAAVMALIAALNPTLISHVTPGGPIDLVPVKDKPQTVPLAVFQPQWTIPAAPADHPPPPVETQDYPTASNPPPNAGTGGGDTGPRLPSLTPARAIGSTHTIPDYPPIAARLGEQGSVRLTLRIDEQGIVTDATVVTSSGYYALDEAAIAWVKSHWRYEPALRDGTPIPASTNAIVTFRLMNRQG